MKWQIGHFFAIKVWLKNSFGRQRGEHWKGNLELVCPFQDKIPGDVGKTLLRRRGMRPVPNVRRGYEDTKVWLLASAIPGFVMIFFCFFSEPFPLKDSISQKFLYRQICAAKYSVVRSYRHSDHLVLTGCTRMPGKGSKFCWEHQVVVKKPLKVISNVLLQEEETPCHLASELSRETVKELIHTQHEEFPKA